MRYFPIGASLLVAGLTCSGAAFLVNCSSDEDTTVRIDDKCEVTRLQPSPSAEATLKLYVEASSDLTVRAADLDRRFQAVCNKMNQSLGLEAGNDIQAACGRLGARLKKAQDSAPKPVGGVKSTFIRTRWSEDCYPDAKAQLDCAAQCGTAAACDVTGACPAGQLAGTCAGKCTGLCETTGPKAACKGACVGVCDMPDAATTPGGNLASCEGECVGRCNVATGWTGRCKTACTTGFYGQCRGTCTGTCDGIAVGTPRPDGGAPTDAGSDAEAGVPPITAPTGQDGNCQGLCVGQCSAEGSGTCTSRCGGDFLGGTCRGAGTCLGTCTAVETACLETCSGTCKNAVQAGSCAGNCVGSCDQPVQNPVCRTSLSCAGANNECKLVCAVRGALAAKCGAPPAPELLVANDWVLYEALRGNAGEMVQLVNELNLVLAAARGIADRAPADYRAIGVVTTYGFACVQQANTTVENAITSLLKAKIVADSLNPIIGQP